MSETLINPAGSSGPSPPLFMTINPQTDVAYTPVLSDAENGVSLTNAGAISVTLPQDSEVDFEIGTTITFFQGGAGQVTFVAGTGATLRSPGPTNKARGQWSTVTAWKIAVNTWLIMGDLAAS